MKFYVDNSEVFELLPWHESLIKNDIFSEIFESDMHRRCMYSLKAPIEKLVYINQDKFKDKLRNLGVQSIPGKLSNFIDVIAQRNDIGLSSLIRNSNRLIRSDQNDLGSLSPSYLRLAITYLNRSETEYPHEQISWVFGEKIKACLKRMHLQWDPKLESRSLEVPLSEEDFVSLVLSQSDYKNRSERGR